MGTYTGLRFKGTVKSEFRDSFEDVALNGDWKDHEDLVIREFGNFSRARFIPCGDVCFSEWESKEGYVTLGFERSYDAETGYWVFQCSLKNYDETIEEFFRILPYFIESVEHLESLYEESRESIHYTLIDSVVLEITQA